MNRDELAEVVAAHAEWLATGGEGKWANLEGAVLPYVDLRGVDLSFAKMAGVNLSLADLSQASLRYVDLRHAYLTDANFCGADLCGALLKEAKINWQSHELIAEILRAAAGKDPTLRKIAGLVAVSHDWCWGKFSFVMNEYERDWARSVLLPWVQDGDEAPGELWR